MLFFLLLSVGKIALRVFVSIFFCWLLSPSRFAAPRRRFVEELLCLSVLYLFVWLFVFFVASVSLLPPSTSLHHDLADWHLPSSHHPPHHTSSLRNQTLPFRKPGFTTEDLRLAILSEMCLPVVVCWQDCSSCLLRKCCVCLFCISLFVCLFVCFLGGFCYPPASFHFPPAQPRRPPLLAAFSAPHVISEKSNTPISEAEFCNRRASFCNFGRKVLLLLLVCWSLCFFFFWWLLLASPLPSLPSTTTSQIDISPPPTIPHTTRHLWETKHSRFGSRVLQQKIFVWQFCPKCVCLLLSVGKIALLVCWGSVVCVCSVSLISGQIQMLQNPPKTSKNTEIHK